MEKKWLVAAAVLLGGIVFLFMPVEVPAAVLLGGIVFLFMPVEAPEPKRVWRGIVAAPRAVPLQPVPPPPVVPQVTKEEFIEIMECTNEWAMMKLRELKTSLYTKRRKANSKSEYKETLEKYYTKEGKIIKDALEEVLQRTRTTQDDYNTALEVYGNDTDVVLVREEFKMSIASSTQAPDLTTEKLTEILEHQFELLNAIVPGPEWIDNTIELARVDDQLYERYGLEADEIIATAIQHQEALKPIVQKVVRKQNLLTRK